MKYFTDKFYHLYFKISPYPLDPTPLCALHTAGQTQDGEAAEAQQATALYNETMAQVRLARSTLLTLTREACKDHPDLLAMFD